MVGHRSLVYHPLQGEVAAVVALAHCNATINMSRDVLTRDLFRNTAGMHDVYTNRYPLLTKHNSQALTLSTGVMLGRPKSARNDAAAFFVGDRGSATSLF